MPDFTCIGGHKPNQSGHTAKGWSIWRRGTTVKRRWGAVEVVRAPGGRTHWVGKTQSAEPMELDSVAEAKAFMATQIRRKTTATRGRGAYKPLLTSILAPRKRRQ